MNKDEAIKALENGSKLTHRLFSKKEWVKQHSNDRYIFEDNIIDTKRSFWEIRTDPAWDNDWLILID